MPDELPSFRYYPDPLGTGVIQEAPDRPCLGCNRIRGYLYMGPVTTEKNFILDEHLCPWCVADGTAAKQFGALFNYAGLMEDVPDSVRDEIEQRTPGFVAWQQEQWLACCGDGASFLGVVGRAELERDYPEAIPAVRKHLRDEYELSKADADEFFNGLSKDGEPSAYLFRCLKCREFLAYVDQT